MTSAAGPRPTGRPSTISPRSTKRSEERRVGKEWRSLCDWSSDVCSSDLTTLKNAMTLMMQNSDNAMTKAVEDYFGRANVQAYANSIGLSATQINHDIGCGTPANRTSVNDLTKIYEEIGRASCRERVEITV